MAAQLLPEILVLSGYSVQADLPLAAEGVLRYVWQHRFGSMLVEVRDGHAFVNGALVEAASAAVGCSAG
jgi:hypothetical protein